MINNMVGVWGKQPLTANPGVVACIYGGRWTKAAPGNNYHQTNLLDTGATNMEELKHEFGALVDAPEDALDWLQEKLENHKFEDGSRWYDESIMIEREEFSLFISTFDGCKPAQIDLLVEFVCEMQVKFSIDKPWHLTWADVWVDDGGWHICGAALVCFKGSVKRMISPRQWISETEAAL
ncbi:hypothetical protein IT157_08065 [bacterium]|nr:hypothetical protein [bacterium]